MQTHAHLAGVSAPTMMGTSETGCDLQRAEPRQVMIVRPYRHNTHDDSAAHVLLRAPQHLHLPEDVYNEGHVQLQAVLPKYGGGNLQHYFGPAKTQRMQDVQHLERAASGLPTNRRRGGKRRLGRVSGRHRVAARQEGWLGAGH